MNPEDQTTPLHSTAGEMPMSVENGQVVSDDGTVYDVREAIESIPWVTASVLGDDGKYHYRGDLDPKWRRRRRS